MIVHFDDLFSASEDNQLTAKKHIVINTVQFQPSDAVPKGAEINGLSLLLLKGKLLNVDSLSKTMILRGNGEVFMMGYKS